MGKLQIKIYWASQKRKPAKPHKPRIKPRLAELYPQLLTPRIKRPMRPSNSQLYTEFTPAQVEFGRAMTGLLAEKGQVNATCAEVLMVLGKLDYRNRGRKNATERDVAVFTDALHAFKKKTRPQPSWSEVLAVAIEGGWRKSIAAV